MNRNELYYRVGMEKYQSQEALNRELVARASTILSFSVGLIGLSGLTLRGTYTIGLETLVVFIVVAALGSAIPFMGLWILKPRDWAGGVNLTELSENTGSSDFTEDELMIRVGNDYMESVKRNEGVLYRRANFLRYMVIGLVFQAIFAGILVVVARL